MTGPDAGEPRGPHLPDLEPVDAEGYATLRAIRVLERVDGRLVPVAGARVSGWSEETGPTSVRSHRIGTGVTDADGFANVTWPEDEPAPFHWVVEAEGRAVWHDAGIGDEVILEPTAPCRFRLLDPFGRPLARARVEVVHGCPHSPVLRRAVSDAAGLVSIEGMAANPIGELWITAPGVSAGPYDYPIPVVGDGDEPPALLTDLGRVAAGVVVDPEGKPLRGVIAREIGYPRGPVTVTGPDGRFELVGLMLDRAIGFFHPDAPFGDRPSVGVEEFVDDVALRIVMRRDRPRGQADGEVRHDVDIEVPGRSGVPVTLVRLADGFTVRGRTGAVARGICAAHVPPGEYRVIAGGGFSEVEEGTSALRVPREESTPVRLEFEPQAELDLRGEKRLMDPVLVRVPGAERTAMSTRYIRIPSAGPAVVVDGDLAPRITTAGPVEGRYRSAEISPRPVVRAVIRVVSEDPDLDPDQIEVEWETAVWFADLGRGPDGRWVGETSAAGRAYVTASAEGHVSASREVTLPTKPGEIDLGTIVLRRSKTRTFRILGPGGETLPDVEPCRLGGGNELPDETGAFEVECGPEPELWVARIPPCQIPKAPPPVWYPLPFVTSLASPAEIRFPPGRLEVVVTDAEGGPLEGACYVDAHRFEVEDGGLDLRGVPDGAYRLIIGARGFLGERQRAVIRGGEHRRVEITLRRR